MDVDTIITNGEFLEELKNFELVMLGEEKYEQQNIGFIFSSNKRKFFFKSKQDRKENESKMELFR